MPRRASLKYQRILLKLSGEALAGDGGHGFDFQTIADLLRATGRKSPIELLAAAAERVLVGHVAERDDAVAGGGKIGLVAVETFRQRQDVGRNVA